MEFLQWWAVAVLWAVAVFFVYLEYRLSEEETGQVGDLVLCLFFGTLATLAAAGALTITP